MENNGEASKKTMNTKHVMAWSRTAVQPPAPKPPRDESEIAENNRNSLKAFVALIKDRGLIKGLHISEEEMAGKVGLSPEQLYAYLHGENRTPNDLPHQLLSAYQALIDTVREENERASLKQTIVQIRNLGLAEGIDITVGEMAGKICLSEEQLYGYLNEEYRTSDELSFRLSSAYKDLIKDEGLVVIIEDLYMDESARRIKFI